MEPKDESSKFYPNLALRILLFLRSKNHKKNFIYPKDLIINFGISKSFLSQKLKVLKEYGLISTQNRKRKKKSDSYLKISITEKGLKIANQILIEGLKPSEKMKIDIGI